MKQLNPREQRDAVKLIKRGALAARDTSCPYRSCWQPHEWAIKTHGAMQTNGRTEWRCGYREREGCCPSPIPAPVKP